MRPSDLEVAPDVLHRLRQGDPAALAYIYDQYADIVFRIGYGLLGEVADAEDLVQDLFLGLPHAARTFEGRGSFPGWLKRVATRTALMLLRQRQVRRASLQRRGWTLARAVRESAAEEDLDLATALRRLTPELRAVFLLKEVHGYSHDEIAQMLGIRAGAAKVRLHRARRKLRAFLMER